MSTTTVTIAALSQELPCKMPLTPYQEIFYHEWRLNPVSSDYHIIWDQVLTGHLDIIRLNKRLIALVNDYLLINSNVYTADDNCYWIQRPLLTEAEQLLQYHPEALTEEEIFQLVLQPFHLENELLFRVYAIRQ